MHTPDVRHDAVPVFGFPPFTAHITLGHAHDAIRACPQGHRADRALLDCRIEFFEDRVVAGAKPKSAHHVHETPAVKRLLPFRHEVRKARTRTPPARCGAVFTHV